MNVLITGGTGLIGHVLTESLLADGHRVTVLTRNPQKAKNILPSDVIPLQWDGRSPEGWGHIIGETDAIVNLAGESIAGDSMIAILTRRWTDVQKERIKQSRLDVGKALVSAIQGAKKKPDVFIQASAVGYYGPHGDEALTESAPGGTDFLAKVCQAWEASTSEVEKLGVRRVVIRSGLVLSTKGGILPIMLLPFRLFVGGPLGSGKQIIPWIHILDQVNAIRFLLENQSAQGAFNLSAPNPVNSARFGRIAGRVLRRPNWFTTPGFALKLALGEKASLVLGGQQAVPQKLLKAGYEIKFKNLEPALQDLL
jgi:uncharacterized protein (TIGR01777 family)